jgi:hypothetical protein
MSHLLLYPILVLGAFNFFWVPVANYVGKRPVFVFASGLLCVCYIWGAVATSYNSLLWSNIIAAFAGSSTEALGAAIVNVSSQLFFHIYPGSNMNRFPDIGVAEKPFAQGRCLTNHTVLGTRCSER